MQATDENPWQDFVFYTLIFLPIQSTTAYVIHPVRTRVSPASERAGRERVASGRGRGLESVNQSALSETMNSRRANVASENLCCSARNAARLLQKFRGGKRGSLLFAYFIAAAFFRPRTAVVFQIGEGDGDEKK